MIVTIDGPAGAGKSTVARMLATRFDLRFLDTGALYRAATLAVLQAAMDPRNTVGVHRTVAQCELALEDERVWLDGHDVTQAIRQRSVSQAVRYVADNVGVREHLSILQRSIAADGRIVTEGRDQGTVVFPDARFKFFLTASPQERARRRYEQRIEQGMQADLEEILQDQIARDQHDRQRAVGALKMAPDALCVDTDGLTLAEVVSKLGSVLTAETAQRGAPRVFGQ